MTAAENVKVLNGTNFQHTVIVRQLRLLSTHGRLAFNHSRGRS